MIDIIKLCKKFRVPHLTEGHHHTKRGWVQLHCPQCGGKGGWHLGFCLATGAFNCWRCGKLEFWRTLGTLLRTDKDGVKAALRELGGPRAKAPIAAERTVITRRRSLAFPPGSGPLQAAHKAYLTNRGFDAGRLETEWQLRGTGHLSGLWAWRVIIPIRGEADEKTVVAYQGRTIGESRPKYKLLDDALCLEDPQSLLYGMEKVTDAVVIVEGATGPWRIGPGAVATLGIDWTPRRANRLRHIKNRFILYDPEPGAQKRAQALANLLSLYPGNTEIITGFSTDPGELTAKEVTDLRRELGLQPYNPAIL